MSSISSVSSKNLYGRLDEGDEDEDEVHEEVEDVKIADDFTLEREGEKAMLDRLKHLSHLSTITEQNSPYQSTTNRDSPRRYITAQKVFENHQTKSAEQTENVKEDKNGDHVTHLMAAATHHAIESDHAYYPLGSEISSQRPVSPRFTVEEVPNYEPILIARSTPTSLPPVAVNKHLKEDIVKSSSASSSPALPKRPPSHVSPFRARSPLSKANSSSSNDSRTTLTPNRARKRNPAAESPALPRRHPVMMTMEQINQRTKSLVTPTNSLSDGSLSASIAALGAEKALKAETAAPDITVTEATEEEGESRCSSTLSGNSFGFERQKSEQLQQQPNNSLGMERQHKVSGSSFGFDNSARNDDEEEDDDNEEAPSTCSEELSSLENKEIAEEETKDEEGDASSAFDSATYYV